MNGPRLNQRVNEIEEQLSPAEWGRWLADEIRKYPSEIQFIKSIAAKSYWDSPFGLPLIALARQAIKKHPGTSAQSIKARTELTHHLAAEYTFFKTLICKCGSECRGGFENNFRDIHLSLLEFHRLALQEAQAPWVRIICEMCRGVSEDPKNSFFLQPLEEIPRSRLLLPVHNWIKLMEMLLIEVAATQAAINRVQTSYFGGHLILNKDDEEKLKKTISEILDVISEFSEWWSQNDNVYRKTVEDKSQEENSGDNTTVKLTSSGQVIDTDFILNQSAEVLADYTVEEWVDQAHSEAVVYCLLEGCERTEFRWKRFQQMFHAIGPSSSLRPGP